MAKKHKKPEDMVLSLAVGLTFFLTLTFVGALSVDLYHAVQTIGNLYGRSI